MKKRLFALFLCLCMVMTLLPVSVFAEGTEAQYGLVGGGASVTSVNPVETPDTHITFKFYNGDVLLDTQVVNGDGQLTAPATPAIEGGRKFLGWYAVDANDQLEAQEFDFSTAYTKYSGRSEVKVMAKFEAVFYVYFMTVEGQVHSTAIANEDNDFKVTPPTDYEPKGKVVTGWKANDVVFTADTVVSADTYVYPVTEDCYWVTFNTTGGSMVPSRSVTTGEALNLSTVTAPTRTGYRFKGWSTTEGGALISSVTPTADTTLYAVWEGDNVTYTVVYWGENADDTNYSTLATASLTGKVGSTVTLDKITGALPSTVSDRQHFEFRSSGTVTINADGSSVLNVYFSRNSYKLTFKEKDGLFSSGKVITTIEAKYDSDIAYVWKSGIVKQQYLDKGYVFKSSVTQKYYSFLQKMPNQDITMTATHWYGSTYYIYYYLEILPGQDTSGLTTTTNGNKTYYLYHTTTLHGSDLSLTYDEDYFPITGFKQRDSRVPSFDWRWSNNSIIYEASLYYLRSSFNLALNNYGVETKEAVPYETDISAKGAQPARPAGFSENAVFKGWYEVPVGQITDSTLPFDFNGKTMPAKDLVLFAYWVEQPVTLTVQVPTLDYTASNDKVAIGTVISGVDVFKDAETKIADAARPFSSGYTRTAPPLTSTAPSAATPPSRQSLRARSTI